MALDVSRRHRPRRRTDALLGLVTSPAVRPQAHKPVIAIDGPAGAGKSTIARMLSHRLALPLLDTGAMYRVIAIEAIAKDVSTGDEEALAIIAEATVIEFDHADHPRVLCNGRDVTDEIRSLPVGQAASELSIHPKVRRALVAIQQQTIAEGGYILEGRDTTTVVAPNADLKIFLTASIEERARRRWLEMALKGSKDTLQEVVVDVVQRDHRDYSRQDSPLMLADDAIIVESYGLTPPDVTQRIVRILEDRGVVPTWVDA